MKKRILSLLLCVVLCLSLMPTGAFAASGSIEITEVNITVPALSGGQTVASLIPVCTATAGGADLYNVAFLSADWEVQNGSIWEPLAGTDTFKANHTYRLRDPMLYLAGGYTFDSSVIVRMNGKEVTSAVNDDFVYFDSQNFVVPCTVFFEMNGHGTAPTAQYDADGRLLEPAAPADDEYAFAGWFADADLTRPMSFPAQLTADTTLYASWKPRVKAIDVTVTQAKRLQQSVWLAASYTVDGSTDNTSSLFAQYTSPDGSAWERVYYTSGIAYDTQNRIEFTVSLTDPDVRMIDEATVVTVHGAEGATCDIQRTADSVKVTVLYVLPPQKFTVKFDTDGHAPAIPDQEVDALSTVDLPDMSAYAEGTWRFTGWYWGENNLNYWHDTDLVWDDIVLTARWDHYVKVTFIMSSTGEEIVGWAKYDTWLRYSEAMDVLYAHDEYYVRDFYLDRNMTTKYDTSEHLMGDITLYVDAKLKIKELDFTVQEPSDGKMPDSTVRITCTDPENTVAVAKSGPWEVSDTGALFSWHPMSDGETFAAGHYYELTMEFMLTDKEHYSFPYGEDMVVKLNGENCRWSFGNAGLIVNAKFVLPGMVEFELNGHGSFIRSQDVQPGQKAARPDDPSASGWKFTGWYTDKDCTTLYDFDTPVNSNLLLYAGWVARVDQVDADFVLPWLHCKAGSEVSALTPNHKEADLSASRILWKKNDGTGWKVMNAGEEFLPNAEYRAEFTVIADSKIPFAENVKATVHGSGTGVTCALDASGNLKVVYTKHVAYTTHEVTFDTEGKGSPFDAQTVEEGLSVTRPADPTEDGYVFDGWYTDTAHTDRFDFDSPVVEDMTLYAHWMRPIHKVMITVPALIVGKTPPEKVFLSTEFGEEGLWFYETEAEWEKDSTRPLDYWHIYGRLQADQDYTMRRIAIPVAGNDWFFADDLEIVSSTGTVEVISVSRPYAAVNIHVTVKSGGISNPTPDDVPSVLTVSFDTQGHGTVESQSVTLDGSAAKPKDPVAAGYTFTGWYTDEACTSLYDFDIPVTSDIILYAGWERNSADPATYTIIAGANSEWTKGSTTGLSFTSDAPFAKFDSVQVDGSTIAAANYTAEEGSTKITLVPAYLETLSIDSHSIRIVSKDGSASTNFTVKAAAQPPVPAKYTVSFNMNGHGTQITGQTVEDGGKATKPANPTASGYTFKGWYTDSTFQTAFDFGTAIHADTTLYAKWVANSVTPTDPTNPKTGDNSHMLLWVLLLAASGVALTGTAIYSRKRKHN